MMTRINGRGYTIVEVMIFMAVSGFMFIIAANFVSGKQSKTEFRQGMNAINVAMRQVINDVGNGFYPSDNSFRCTAPGAGAPFFDRGGALEQGTNKDCVFMGKVIQFRPETGDQDYYVYSMAGRHYTTSQDDGTIPVNFAEANPRAIYNPAAGIDLTDKRTLQWGLKATLMVSCDVTCQRTPPATRTGVAISAVGFFTSFGNYNSASNLASGAQNVVVVPIRGDGINGHETEQNMAGIGGYIDNDVTDTRVESNPFIIICFEGGDNQKGTLNIGGFNGQRLATEIHINEVCPATP